MHGDFRLGNVIVDTTGLQAVIDWELAHPPLTSLAPWRPVNCVGRLEEQGSLTVRAARYAPQEGLDHAWWVLEGPLDASDWDALELAGSWTAGTEAVLFWVREGEEEPHRLGLPVDPSTAVARFDLATQPAWSGRINEVRLFPAGGGEEHLFFRCTVRAQAADRPIGGVDRERCCEHARGIGHDIAAIGGRLHHAHLAPVGIELFGEHLCQH